MAPPPSPSLARRFAQVLPWVGFAAAVGGLVWVELQRQDALAEIVLEQERSKAIEADVMAERIADRRQCTADKEQMAQEHQDAITALKAAFDERQRVLAAKAQLAVEEARLAGAESVLRQASSSDPEANALLGEVQSLRAEIESRQAALADAERQLIESATEIERLGQEKRKLARALDEANLLVIEAEQARGEATREVQRAQERVVELEWTRFELQTLQELCWDGLKRKRDKCREAVGRTLLQSKVEWLVCRLEENARPTLTTAPADQAPTDGARLLVDNGSRSTWLVLCDHSLSDG